MSRDLEDNNYYITHGGKIPVKWTAPEVLLLVLGSIHIHWLCQYTEHTQMAEHELVLESLAPVGVHKFNEVVF